MKIIIRIIQCLLICPMSLSVKLFLIVLVIQIILAISQWIISTSKYILTEEEKDLERNKTIKQIRKEKILKINKTYNFNI